MNIFYCFVFIYLGKIVYLYLPAHETNNSAVSFLGKLFLILSFLYDSYSYSWDRMHLTASNRKLKVQRLKEIRVCCFLLTKKSRLWNPLAFSGSAMSRPASLKCSWPFPQSWKIVIEKHQTSHPHSKPERG